MSPEGDYSNEILMLRKLRAGHKRNSAVGAWPLREAATAALLGLLLCGQVLAQVAGEKECSNLGTGSSDVQTGVHYELVNAPTLALTGDHAIQVVEFFSYRCSHCYRLETHLTAWNRVKPAYVQVSLVPVTWSAPDSSLARLFYTLEVLGRSDLHASVFDAIHRKYERLWSEDAKENLTLHRQFASGHGIDTEDFERAYTSPGVASKLDQATSARKEAQLDRVPLIFIEGKYKIGLQHSCGSEDGLVNLIAALAEREHIR